MIVTYYHRRPLKGYYSIEKVFRDIRKALPDEIRYRVAIAKYESCGILKRFYNCIEAIFRQGDVNHITGDIHYVSIFLKRKKTVLTIHDCVSLRRLKGLKKWILYFFWYWLAEKRCKYITTGSESTKKELLEYLKCNPDKIHVIPNPISEDFQYVPFNFNSEKPTILQIGTRPNKNLKKVAEALRGISCRMAIIGSLSQEQLRILKEFNIDYSSFEDISDKDLFSLYIKSDIVIFVSTYEGFGMPILEAQAIGRPLITSNVFSMPEVAGEGACLVDPYNTPNIREALIKIINDSDYRDKLIINGLKNVERFRPKFIVDRYIELYNKLARTN